MRRHISFFCEGDRLFATLDLPDGQASAGLLIVSGGNEVRAGAWNGQALLAARLAAHGLAVMRFDRRGVGESEGANTGYRGSQPDIAAAIAAFRAEVPGLLTITAWGNCDAASALMLGSGCGLDRLVLSNPWTFDDEDTAQAVSRDEAAPTPRMTGATLRAHYLRRLTNPAAVLRLVQGQVGIGALIRSLMKAVRKDEVTTLCADMAAGLSRFSGAATILLAERDRTAQAFGGQWGKRHPHALVCPGASHSFVEPEAQKWLYNKIFEIASSEIR